MGNCWGSPVVNKSSSINGTSTSGTSKNNSNENRFSGSSTVNSRFSASASLHEAFPNGQILPIPNLNVFSFAELKSATRNFRPDTVLGEGGFGKVFKGWIDEKNYTPSKVGSGMVVAVKKLNSESMQGFEEWQSEVNFLGRLYHPNLVKLLGYCWEDKELLGGFSYATTFMEHTAQDSNRCCSRNPKLRAIPALADDLEKVFHLRCRTENKETSQFGTKDMAEENNDKCHYSIHILPVFSQDLNCLPYSNAAPRLLDNLQQNDEVVSDAVVKKKRRAATEHIARIDLADLAKYFDLPIAEASRNLKVGLTVLKRKCRELGIPRWPHRKIKSLDTLIHNLQEEAKRQERENKAVAAMAVIKRQRILEREKEGIERKPFMEIQSETKRFRQDVFKRRHRARVVKSKC